MALSQSDELRLNVLLAQEPQAIKISESTMQLLALTETGEARIQLHPNCRSDQYLKNVRELLSTQVLGSPGGYPIFLKRWTRMGQAREESLARLLLLGEDEAVTAVVHAPGLTKELAAHAWWVLPDASSARQMLNNPAIAQSPLSKDLSDFLLEFLPFEQEPQATIDSVRLILQAGWLTEADREHLWKRAGRKASYLVGFLQAMPNALPVQVATHPRYESVRQLRQSNKQLQDCVMLGLLERAFSESGQAYLQTVHKSFEKPNDQNVVTSLMNTLGSYFSVLNKENRRYTDLPMWNEHAVQLVHEHYNGTIEQLDEDLVACCYSLLALSFVDETMVNPVFALSDAIGSVMRKRLKPVTDEVLSHVDRLRAN